MTDIIRKIKAEAADFWANLREKMALGHVKVWRSMKGSRCASYGVDHLGAMVWFVMSANRAPGRFAGRRIERGQMFIGRKSCAKEWCVSERRFRTIMDHLAKEGFLTIEATTTGSVVSVVNFDLYQARKNEIDEIEEALVRGDQNGITTDQRPTNESEKTTSQATKEATKEATNGQEQSSDSDKGSCIEEKEASDQGGDQANDQGSDHHQNGSVSKSDHKQEYKNNIILSHSPTGVGAGAGADGEKTGTALDCLTDQQRAMWFAWLTVWQEVHGGGKAMNSISADLQLLNVIRMPEQYRLIALEKAAAGQWQNIRDVRNDPDVKARFAGVSAAPAAMPEGSGIGGLINVSDEEEEVFGGGQ